MNRVVSALRDSVRPLILLGGGARASAPEIIAFAERWQIPMMTTWNAVDLVPYAHPLFVGRPGIVAIRGSNKAIQACDLLLSIGARLDQATIAYDYANFAPGAVKILVDVDLGESLKIPNLDIFIHMDATLFIQELSSKSFSVSTSEWLAQCAIWKQDRLERYSPSYMLMDELSDTLPDDAIIVAGSSCLTVAVFCAGFRNKAGQRFILSSCGLGTMGATLPVAIGAALASGKPVVMFDGDGSIMQNVQELELVRRYKLPITIYIINNKGYASIRSSEVRAFGRTRTRVTIPDINKLAAAFGVDITVINSNDEILSPRVLFDGRGSLSDMWPYEEQND